MYLLNEDNKFFDNIITPQTSLNMQLVDDAKPSRVPGYWLHHIFIDWIFKITAAVIIFYSASLADFFIESRVEGILYLPVS